jgi:aspartate/glutamate racemase
MTRVALIHALAHSVPAINAELARLWPECTRMNLLDDSLSTDLARSAAGLDERMTERFMALARCALSTGADAILFTCSAFGPCIDEVKRRWPDVPVLKPSEAMIEDAVRAGRRIGLVASFEPTLVTMPSEFPSDVDVLPMYADGALDALDNGDAEAHDRIVADAALRAERQGADVVALAQFSMTRAAPAVAQALRVPLLTTPGSAVRALRARLKGQGSDP